MMDSQDETAAYYRTCLLACWYMRDCRKLKLKPVGFAASGCDNIDREHATLQKGLGRPQEGLRSGGGSLLGRWKGWQGDRMQKATPPVERQGSRAAHVFPFTPLLIAEMPALFQSG